MYTVLLLKDCPYCHAAEELLKKHHLDYEGYVFHDSYVEGETYYDKKVFKKKYGEHSTFPRIYHNDKFIGGYGDLKERLEK
jgi:glutaredoxin